MLLDGAANMYSKGSGPTWRFAGEDAGSWMRWFGCGGALAILTLFRAGAAAAFRACAAWRAVVRLVLLALVLPFPEWAGVALSEPA